MATISLRTLTLGDAVSFLLTASPLVVGMMIVPTLAASAGREQLPPWPVLPLTLGTLREHFLLRRGGHWYTAISHVLCHMDAAHLAGNISGLLFTGASVHSALGPVGWWVTVGGGALLAAADPAGWRVKQAQSWLNAWTGELFPSFTPSLARAWTTHGAWSACGASAAVCAQCGAEAAMCLDQLASLLVAIREADGEVQQKPLLFGRGGGTAGSMGYDLPDGTTAGEASTSPTLLLHPTLRFVGAGPADASRRDPCLSALARRRVRPHRAPRTRRRRRACGGPRRAPHRLCLGRALLHGLRRCAQARVEPPLALSRAEEARRRVAVAGSRPPFGWEVNLSATRVREGVLCASRTYSFSCSRCVFW